MTSWNLDNFDNIYATLAQSAYTGRPISFPKKSQEKTEKIDFSQDVTYKYKENGKIHKETTQGASGDGYPDKSDPNASKTELYLQPDETLHTTKDGHQKGLLT
ncbi:hypothetical protein ACFOSE_04245, partial [Streptococcus dentapri]